MALTKQKMTFSGQTFATTPNTHDTDGEDEDDTCDDLPSYRRTSFFRRRRFLRFWTIKLTFITFACKNHYFLVDWSRRVFTGEKVNWPAAYSWIALDSPYMAKISAAAYLRMRLISEYIWYLTKLFVTALEAESQVYRRILNTICSLGTTLVQSGTLISKLVKPR